MAGQWSSGPLSKLRERLGMNKWEFGRLLGVDERTVWRWEEPGKYGEPRGTVIAILNGIAHGLDRHPDCEAQLVAELQSMSAVGGIAFIMTRMLDDMAPTTTPSGRSR